MAAFDPTSLLPAEHEVVDRTSEGVWADVTGRPDDERCVRADFLRHLLLGLPAELPAEGRTLRPWPIRLPGVRVRGALIEGRLDLADCAGPAGAGLPALALEGCDCPAEIDLNNARLARLSLKDSRIVFVAARDARIDGPLDVSGVAPMPVQQEDDAMAWIDAHGCTIQENLLAARARLVAPRTRVNVAPGDARYALRLSGAVIEGSIRFTPGAQASGGITLRSSRLDGDLAADGAVLKTGGEYALDCQGAMLGGNVLLRGGFETQGCTWLFGVKIAGTLDCTGAKMANRTDDGASVSLEAANAEIGGATLLRDGFEAHGRISLSGAKISGNLACDGAKMMNRTDNGTGNALVSVNAKIGGAVLLRNGFEAQGCVSLLGAEISGSFECDGAKMANRTDDGVGVSLEAANAQIGGAVLLRNGFEAQGRVSVFGAKIGGSLECVGAKMTNRTDDGVGVSLEAASAQIGGAALLRNGFEAQGRVILFGAKIAGNFECGGAKMTNRTENGDGTALLAEGVEIGGAALLRNGFETQGRISLSAAKISGNLACDGGKMANRTDNGAGDALIAENVEIGGNILLRNGFEAEGRVSLLGAKIAGNLACDGAKMADRTDNGAGTALLAERVEIGGSALLRDGFEAQGRVSLLGAKIASNLACDGAKMTNHTDNGMADALLAENAEIVGNMSLGNGFGAQGRVSLWGARIDGSVYCAGATLRNETQSGYGTTLQLRGVAIGGSLEMNNGFVSIGRLSLRDASIGRSLDCTRATFIAPVSQASASVGDSALDGANASVGGEANFTHAGVLGCLVVSHLKVGGSLTWAGLRFPRETIHGGTNFAYRHDSAPARFDLSHAHVGAAIEAHDLTAEVPLLVDLGGAHAGVLDDEGFPAGWGAGPDGAGLACKLDLDGFVYQRIADLAQPNDGFLNRMQSARRHARQRVAWLNRQEAQEGRSNFVPQPYRQLAKVLREHGLADVARKIAIAEQWATPAPEPVTKGLRFVFGHCFGFGLSPWRASVTLLVLLGIGYCGVREAQQRGWMAINTSYSLGTAFGPDTGREVPVFQRLDRAGAVEVPRCGKHDIQALFYAMDMMLPIVPLHQEDKCELARSPDTEWQRWIAAVFSIIGKIATSLALLTYTGVLKPKEE